MRARNNNVIKHREDPPHGRITGLISHGRAAHQPNIEYNKTVMSDEDSDKNLERYYTHAKSTRYKLSSVRRVVHHCFEYCLMLIGTDPFTYWSWSNPCWIISFWKRSWLIHMWIAIELHSVMLWSRSEVQTNTRQSSYDLSIMWTFKHLRT